MMGVQQLMIADFIDNYKEMKEIKFEHGT